jgi:hypothetical protein
LQETAPAAPFIHFPAAERITTRNRAMNGPENPVDAAGMTSC